MPRVGIVANGQDAVSGKIVTTANSIGLTVEYLAADVEPRSLSEFDCVVLVVDAGEVRHDTAGPGLLALMEALAGLFGEKCACPPNGIAEPNRSMAADEVSRSAESVEHLSAREKQVLRLIGRGLTHAQIARQLSISRHTADTYVKRIKAKLHAGNKADLTRAALCLRYS